MRILQIVIITAACLGISHTASAITPIVLNFEGARGAVNDFYNGGTDQLGNSGVNYGVHFSSNTLAIRDTDPAANFSLEPSPTTAMLFLTGASAILNYAPGFDTGFSFAYTTVTFSGVVRVYDGLSATGNLLGTINLLALGNGPDTVNNNPFSTWVAGSLGFSGIAKSIDFGGTANQVVYDNITFGSITPGVPEPSTYAMVALGLAGIAAARRRRNRSTRANASVACRGSQQRSTRRWIPE